MGFWLLLATTTTVSAAELPQSWSLQAGATPTVSVNDISGHIRVAAAAGDTVGIQASARGGDAAARRQFAVEVTSDPAAGRVDVQVRCADHDCHNSIDI